MLKKYLSNILSVFLFLVQADAARILAIFPAPSISHQIVFRPLIQELVNRGHEVTVITPNPRYTKENKPENLTEIDVQEISYKHIQKSVKRNNGENINIIQQIKGLLYAFSVVQDYQLQIPEVQEVFKKDRKYFDLLLLEACSRIAPGVQNIFDAPIIQMSSFGALAYQYSYFGAPTHPLLYPTPGRHRLYNLSIWEKILELCKHIVLDYILLSTIKQDLDIIQKHFNYKVRSQEELLKNVKMLFINEHPIWADNRPLPPNILYIGGIHETPEKPLPADLKSYLDSSKYGVIYVSFGTNVIPSLISRQKIKIMTKVFSQLPYEIIMKWDEDKLPGQRPNMKVYKWLPQPDLLKHPKIKLFITQGGLQSTDEAINAGVPLLGIPMLGDQWYNTEKYIHHKIGQQLDIQSLNEIDLKNAIETVIKDKSYKQNIIKLRTLMRQHPVKPLDLAVWWTEHIIKYGGDHLRPPSANLHWTEYYEVKLVAILLCIIIVILSIVLYIVYVYSKFVKRIILSNHIKLKLK